MNNTEKGCSTCFYNGTINDHCEFCSKEYSEWKNGSETISFPILNNLTPTVQGCTNKLIEELGELLTLIGKGHQQSGESEQTVEQITEDIEMNMVREAFDVAQSAVTMAHTLCSKHGIDMEMMMRDHRNKLYERGYLK